jgi:hypothetical protein
MIGFRKSHAVVIGIDEYRNGVPTLRTAGNDARRVAEAMESGFGYAVRLLAEDVTLGKLRVLFGETLPGEVEADDRLLVYFAGHGIALDGDDGPAGYLVPQDARADDRDSFLPMTELSGWLERLPCRHLLLVLDCCFAGAFRWSSTRDLGALPDVIHRERFDRYIRDPAWQVLTSAAYDQKALDVLSGETIGVRGHDPGQVGHSPFAAALLRALQGEADLVPRPRDGRPGGDGVITATELYLYLRECVEAGAQGDGHRQTPGLWPLTKHDKGEFIHLVPGHELNLPPAPPLDEANNPYRGLQSYDEAQAALFFGRTRFVDVLAERVRAQALTIVLGASGTGKSSIVKAGLLPLLRSEGSDAWQILQPLRPGKSPLSVLASVTIPGTTEANYAERLADLWTDSGTLARRIDSWARTASEGRLVLVVDQLEELITLCWDAGERAQFFAVLGEALASHPERLRVVITLRSDFEPQFAETPLRGSWMPSRVVVPPMSLDEYREAIEGPAAVKVLYFQGRRSSQEFISRLIGDVAQTPGALPLLSFTLSELYHRYLDRRGDDRSLREEDYEQIGGVGGSLRNRADEVFLGLPDNDHRATMRRVMLRMVSVEGGELARRRVPHEELLYDDPMENPRVQEVLRRLTDTRLVVEGKEVDDQPFVEPAHDELIRGWNRLLQWSRDEAESLQLRRRLTPASVAWGQRHGGLWLVEPRLNVLKQVLRTPGNWLNRIETQFLRKSLVVRRAIALASIGALVAAFTVITGLGLVANGQRNRALTALDETQHALGRSLMSPIGISDAQFTNPGEVSPMTVSEAEALWDVATLAEERVRILFLKQALEKYTTANQLRNCVGPAVHSAVGLDGRRRLQVIDEIVLPTLRDKARLRDPINLEVLMACVEVGDQLEMSRTSSGAEAAHLAVATAVDAIKSSSTPDWRAVVTFRTNLSYLTRTEMEGVGIDLERFVREHSTTNSLGGIEPMRGPLIGTMLLELRHRLEPDRPTAILPKGQAGAPVEMVLSMAQERYESHQRFLRDGPGPGNFYNNRYSPELSDLGPRELALGWSDIQRGSRAPAPSMSLRKDFKTNFKSKCPDPTQEQALARATSIREEVGKPEPDYRDNSFAILTWVADFNVVAPKLPEDLRRNLADMLMGKILAKLTKTVLTQGFGEAFVVLAEALGPEATYGYFLRILSAKSELLEGWENPGQKAQKGNTVANAYVFGSRLLHDRSLTLGERELINILKYPICVGVLRRVVLDRLCEKLRSRPETPFESVWDLATWLEAHDPELTQLARRPAEGPKGPLSSSRTREAVAAR